jgi:non-heme chloroperoxidase
VARAVLLGATVPLIIKTGANPDGAPGEAFDAIRAGLTSDRSQYFQDFSVPFFGANRPGSAVSAGCATGSG